MAAKAATRATTRPQRVTLQDVADRAGCSAALVSTVINRARSSSVASEQLTRRIVEAAEALGYRPDFASQSLARRSTRTIGLYVLPHFGTSVGYPYEGAILRGVEQVCQQRQYDLLMINVSGQRGPEVCLDKFAERRIDGLMLLHTRGKCEWVRPLLERYANVVAVNYYGDAPLLTVNFDDKAATSLAVEHLHELGHRRIGYIGQLGRWGPGEQLRYAGYAQAMERLGLAIEPRWVFERPNEQAVAWAEQLEEAARSDQSAGAAYISRCADDDSPTAVVCFSDRTAIASARYFKHRNWNVPGHISVIGLDDMELCREVEPPMSSIRQPLEEMGAEAVRLLIDSTDRFVRAGRAKVARTAEPPALAPPTLVQRQSTAAPRRERRRSGFTLVELLVVVSIIAVLMAVLLPALNKARAAGQSVTCMSNQRQLLLAIGMYADQSQGRYPPGEVQLPDPSDGNMKPYRWFTKPFVGGMLNTATDKPYYTTVKIFFCPATQFTYSSAGAPLYGGNFGIGYNCNPKARIWRSDYSGNQQFNRDNIANTSQLLLLADVSDGVGNKNNNRWVQPYNGASNPSDPAFEATSYRHQRRTNVGFADGHVEGFNADVDDDYVMGTHQDQGLDAAINNGLVSYIASN